MAGIGYAVLPVVPSLKGLQEELKKKLEGPLKTASSRAGKQLESSLSVAAKKAAAEVAIAQKKVEKSLKSIEAHEKKIAAAKDATVKATGQVETAEKRLETVTKTAQLKKIRAEQKFNKLRDSGKASAEDLKAAELELETAREKADQSVERAADAVVRAREREKKAVDKEKTAVKALSDAKKRSETATLNLRAAEVRAAKATMAASSKFARLRERIMASSRAARKGTKRFDGLGRKLTRLPGLMAGVAGVGGMGMFFGKAVTEGRELDKVMGTLQAVSGSSAEQMAEVSERAKQLGVDTSLAGTSAASATDAMLSLARGGMSVKDAMDAAKGSIQLAGSAQIDAGQAADIQVAALNTFGLSADKAGHVADVLTNAANSSATTVSDLAEGLKYASPMAAQFGVSLEDTNTALGLLANNGVKGSMAGTGVRKVLTSLTEPSAKANAALTKLGVTMRDANGNFVGFSKLSEQLHAAKQNLDDMDFAGALKAAFGEEGAGAASALAAAGAEGFDQLREKMDKAGSAGETAGAVLNGLNGTVDRISNNTQAFRNQLYELAKPMLMAWGDRLAAAVGRASEKFPELVAWAKERLPVAFEGLKNIASPLVAVLQPVLGMVGSIFTSVTAHAPSVVDWLSKAGQWVKRNRAWLVPLVAELGTFAAAISAVAVANLAIVKVQTTWLALQGAIKGATVAQEAFKTISAAGPWGWAAIAIAAVVAALVAFFTKTEVGRKLWAKFTEAVTGAWEKIKAAWANVGPWFQELWDKIKTAWSNASDSIKQIWQGLQDMWQTLVDGFNAAVDSAQSIVQGITAAWNAVPGFFSSLWQRIKTAFFDLFSDAIRRWQAIIVTVIEAVQGIFRGLKTVMRIVWQKINSTYFLPFLNALELLKRGAHEAVEAIKRKFVTIVDAVKDIPKKIKGIFSHAGEWLKDAGRAMVDGFLNGIKSAWHKVTGFISNHMPHVSALSGNYRGGRLPAYSVGGRLPMMAGPRDSILGVNKTGVPIARVDAGEWIINRHSSRKYDGLLRAINSNTLPGYAAGGTVGGQNNRVAMVVLQGVGNLVPVLSELTGGISGVMQASDDLRAAEAKLAEVRADSSASAGDLATAVGNQLIGKIAQAIAVIKLVKSAISTVVKIGDKIENIFQVFRKRREIAQGLTHDTDLYAMAQQKVSHASHDLVESYQKLNEMVAKQRSAVTDARQAVIRADLQAARATIDAKAAEWNLTQVRMNGLTKLAAAEAKLQGLRKTTFLRGEDGINALSAAMRRAGSSGRAQVELVAHESVEQLQKVQAAEAEVKAIRAQNALALLNAEEQRVLAVLQQQKATQAQTEAVRLLAIQTQALLATTARKDLKDKAQTLQQRWRQAMAAREREIWETQHRNRIRQAQEDAAYHDRQSAKWTFFMQYGKMYKERDLRDKAKERAKWWETFHPTDWSQVNYDPKHAANASQILAGSGFTSSPAVKAIEAELQGLTNQLANNSNALEESRKQAAAVSTNFGHGKTDVDLAMDAIRNEFARKRAGYQADVDLSEQRKKLAEATTKTERDAILEAIRIGEEKRAELFKNQGSKTVTIKVAGDAVTTETLQSVFDSLGAEIGDVRFKVETLERKAEPSALSYAGSRR